MIEAVLVVGLVSFYITFTIRYLEGPFGIYHWIMSRFGIDRLPLLDANGLVIGYVEDMSDSGRFLTKLASCFWCSTTWVSLAIAVIYVWKSSLNYGQGVFVWLAAAGLSGWLFERIPDGTSE